MTERKKTRNKWAPLAFMAFVVAIAFAAFVVLLNKETITEPLPEGGATASPR